jgi:hypothetical protein
MLEQGPGRPNLVISRLVIGLPQAVSHQGLSSPHACLALMDIESCRDCAWRIERIVSKANNGGQGGNERLPDRHWCRHGLMHRSQGRDACDGCWRQLARKPVGNVPTLRLSELALGGHERRLKRRRIRHGFTFSGTSAALQARQAH